MIKVGIEVPDQNFSGIDLSQPELGNPGVGGSEYLFTLLASQLIKNGLDVIVYHYSSNSLPIGLHDSVLGDSESMISKAEADGVDILIHQVGKLRTGIIDWGIRKFVLWLGRMYIWIIMNYKY